VRRLLAIARPALLVSVGYMDPGNWATDLEGGARFGYRLLWILVASNLVALLLQALSARLGTVTGLNLAQCCRARYSPAQNVVLWLLAELAICACDLAELLGSAIALNMLFGVPLIWGALLTVADVLLVLPLRAKGMQALSAVVLALLAAIALCLAYELAIAKPSLAHVVAGLQPRIDRHSLYLAIAMLGATVMPHNLYLHSELVPHALGSHSTAERNRALRQGVISSCVALNLALLINAAILVLAATVFAPRALPVTDLREAYQLLTPLTSAAMASALFAIGLLCAGQSATLTGTLAGQIVMEGFLQLKLSAVARRLLTRSVAIGPVVLLLWLGGDHAVTKLLVASQVVLSLQLPFAVVPLIRFTTSRRWMGEHALGRFLEVGAYACAALLIAADGAWIANVVGELRATAPLAALALAVLAALGALLLVWIAWTPLHGLGRRGTPALSSRARCDDVVAADDLAC
jgi:manganese transport protein